MKRKRRIKIVKRPRVPYRLVLVEWEDSARPISAWQWVDEYQAPDAIMCISVGYVIVSNRRTLAIAQNFGDMEQERVQVSGIIRIPQSSVRRMIDL